MNPYATTWKTYLYERLLETVPFVIRWRESSYIQRKYRQILSCQDNQKIPRHPNAGKIIDGCQVMHNGLKIVPDSYAGPRSAGQLTKFFELNRGVHEPSEEFAFQTILPTLPPSATIVELGSFWAFYSMWFCSVVPDAKAYMVEPDPHNLEQGKKNFALNGLKGQFFNAYVGARSGVWKDVRRSLRHGMVETASAVPMIAVDDFVVENHIDFIDVLHVDIQGSEVEMLRGANRMLGQHRVHYLFLSTHSDWLHAQCLEILRDWDYVILCEANVKESMHVDGFIVARARNRQGPDQIAVHRASDVLN